MSTVITLLTILAKYGPLAYEKAIALIKAKDPTDADWDALLFAVRKLDYDQAIEDAKLRNAALTALSEARVKTL